MKNVICVCDISHRLFFFSFLFNSIRFFLLDFRDISLTYVNSGLRFFFPETARAEEQGYHANIPYPRRTCPLFNSDNMRVSDFNLSIYERDTCGSFLISLIFPVNIPHLFPIHHLSDV